jgi:tetratricopeptide (TPR) repeat protein
MLQSTSVKAILSLAVGLAALALGGSAFAAMTVYSDNAQSCYQAAKYGDIHGTGLDDCSEAMFGMANADPDLARTLVNRGVVYLHHYRFTMAQADFDSALTLNPKLGEAYANRGAARIGMGRFAQGISDIDLGLPLGTDEPEKAYYNRALAEEFLDDEKAAYFDYLKAEQLKPSWDAPKKELTRFTVSTR